MKNKLLIILIILILSGLGFLTYYKYRNKPNNASDNQKLIIRKLTHKKKDLVYSDILDKDTYKNNIITKYFDEFEYTLYDNDKSLIGKVYLDENKNLYITSDNEYEVEKISNIKFDKMYSYQETLASGLHVYLISEDGKLYYYGLLSNNINDVKLVEIKTKYKAIDFVDINFDADMDPAVDKLFVLEDDGNIYEINSSLRYKEDIKSVFNYILVYPDKTFSNLYGNMIEDDNGNYYKVKYIFYADANDEYLPYESIIIVTDDNRFISILDEDNFEYSYEDPLKVKSIEFDKKHPFEYGKLKVDFGEEEITFDAGCSSYYCINDFELIENDVEEWSTSFFINLTNIRKNV